MKNNILTIVAIAIILTSQTGCIQTALVAGAGYGAWEGYKMKKEIRRLQSEQGRQGQDIERLGYGWQVHEEAINRPAYMNDNKSVTSPIPSWRSQIDVIAPQKGNRY